MRSVIKVMTVSVLIIFATCSKIFDVDIEQFENPVNVEYSDAHREAVLAKWGRFCTEYNVSFERIDYKFDDVSHYMDRLWYAEPTQLLPADYFSGDSAAVVQRLGEFMNKWRLLFGIEMNDLELQYFGNEEDIYFEYGQSKLNGVPFLFDYHTRFRFEITRDGKLKRITSNTIPPVQLNLPKGYNFDAMKRAITGKTFSVSEIFGQVEHVFAENDNYKLIDGYRIIEKREGGKMQLYVAKGMYAGWGDTIYKLVFIFWFDPVTAEIIDNYQTFTS